MIKKLTKKDYELACIGFAMRLFPEAYDSLDLLNDKIKLEADTMRLNGWL